ncbi:MULTISPECIES: DUF6525 family protein [Sulfitobacter]|uniref:DUF6525 family protein n=1 Tax=Sulfitobacter profundi TaxID=2679961 RepID=A0ABW1Z0L9_9RHOB|nr:DUF6525 family protein [Sulfitobacter indolifex]
MSGRKRNLRSGLKQRRRQGDPMAAYDRLPPPLRAWLAQVALPWSPQSAHRLWCRDLQRCEGDAVGAALHLSRAEHRMLAQDRLQN